jgi:hypothetical protein
LVLFGLRPLRLSPARAGTQKKKRGWIHTGAHSSVVGFANADLASGSYGAAAVTWNGAAPSSGVWHASAQRQYGEERDYSSLGAGDPHREGGLLEALHGRFWVCMGEWGRYCRESNRFSCAESAKRSAAADR